MRLIRFLTLLSAISIAVCCKGTADGVDAYVAEDNWKGVISWCASHSDSLIMKDVYELNAALANEGQLADRVFEFPQAGSAGLLPEWNTTATGISGSALRQGLTSRATRIRSGTTS